MSRHDITHEQVLYGNDAESGLRAIVALFSTALGPALGGVRFFPYASEAGALQDVLNLSRAMAYKAACAGLPLGGGKAVIIGDPNVDKSDQLLRAFGRFVEAMEGRYYTACDVGTTTDDMAVVAEETRYATGCPADGGGTGDSAILTAFGVYRGMCAAAMHLWGDPNLRGRRVGILGVGKVGRRLSAHLVEAGASVLIADVDRSAVERVRQRYPEIEVTDPEKLLTATLDVFSPCAWGGILDRETATRLDSAIVCGGANNQLAYLGLESVLDGYGVLYVPDYVVNAGGLIQVAAEVCGYSEREAWTRTAAIFDTTTRVLESARTWRVSPGLAAGRLAEMRMSLAYPRQQVVELPEDPES
jgi:valine dehydrogenase (NAD+)